MRPLLRAGFGALLLWLPLASHAWWNDQWTVRKQITLNTSPAGADLKAPLTDVPVLIRLHTGNFDFSDAKEDGSDLRFVAADENTLLKHHVELWDPVNELALIWVRVPALAPGSTAEHIWLYAGNQKAAPASDPKGTYDASMALVLHFGKDTVDASSFGQQATATGIAPLNQGPIDGAASFNGTAQIKVAAAPSLRVSAQNGVSYSAWVRIGGPQSGAQLFSQTDGSNAVSVGIAGTKLTARANAAQVQSATDLTPGTWHHVAAVLGGGKLSLLQDGKLVGEAAATAVDISGELTIGAGFTGDLDEVQVSSSARSPDWFKAAWAGQGADAKLVAYGQAEEASSGGHSYFKILLGAVTLDGWVVIVILMAMMIVSIAVMIGKALFVARTDKANQLFLESFERDPDGMLDPGKVESAPRQLAGSSLFRIWRIGLRELKQRFDQYDRSGQPRVVTAQALGAIKASLDAGMVRETTRLNSQMVLLTIAISGGPFLGLLGTVVGVMITFAAIAAVGDVNVNSIAPGIAAALVATVAGLGVAIPSLFGYNYLASRIKTVSNEMTVFADELVTRMAEKYAP